MDSTGQTIDFLLTAKRDAAATKSFLSKSIELLFQSHTRAINVDGEAILQRPFELSNRKESCQCKFLNSVIEQDSRVSKKRTWLAKSYKIFPSARRTLEGTETIHMIQLRSPTELVPFPTPSQTSQRNQPLTFSQTFGYDNVNRLTSVTDSGGWSRGFNYDSYGNAWLTGNSGAPLAGNTPTANVYGGANQIAGSSYDAAGNQLTVNGNTASYDAENHVIRLTASAATGGGVASYAYDGLGRRTQKALASGTTVYVYDAFGQLAAEYSGDATADWAWGTHYLSTDQLGSTRLVTDIGANAVTRHDYLPFGEELPGGYAGRNSQWNPTGDNVDQRFTAQVRDQESGLDYFNARYFDAALARFTSPDPGNAGADVTDPQTWNGYAYVRNHPLALMDPSGMYAEQNPDSGYPGCVANGTEGCITISVATIGGRGPGGSTGSSGGGSYTTTLPRQPSPPKNPIGIRTPGQTFGACMSQHADEYSLAGMIDTAAALGGRNPSLTTNPVASFVLGNSINTFLFGSISDNLPNGAGIATNFVTAPMTGPLTYGRRTTDIMALNLAGRGGVPLALGRSTTAAKSLIGKASSALSLRLSFAERLGLDAAFTGAEAINCSMTF